MSAANTPGGDSPLPPTAPTLRPRRWGTGSSPHQIPASMPGSGQKPRRTRRVFDVARCMVRCGTAGNAGPASRMVSHRRSMASRSLRSQVPPLQEFAPAPVRIQQWAGPDLNRRHPHFQCGALPTELPARSPLVECTRGGSERYDITSRGGVNTPVERRSAGGPPTSGQIGDPVRSGILAPPSRMARCAASRGSASPLRRHRVHQVTRELEPLPGVGDGSQLVRVAANAGDDGRHSPPTDRPERIGLPAGPARAD